MDRRNLLLVLPVLLTTSVLARPLPAQLVRGRLVDAGEQAAAIVLVRLLAADGHAAAETLSDSTGDFTLRAPGAGQFRLRAERIGFASLDVGPFTVSRDGVALGRIRLATAAVELAPITVAGERRCHMASDGGAAAAVWQEVRKALALTAVAGEQHRFAYLVERVDRRLDLKEQVLEQRLSREMTLDGPPFTSLTPGEYLRGGMVQRNELGDWTFFGPDASLIASEEFLQTHCLRVLPAGADSVVEVAFETVPRRWLPDIEGVVAVDRRTNELRSVEFLYSARGAEYRHIAQGGRAVGRISFGRLPSGYWIIREWRLRAPIQALTDMGGLVRLGWWNVAVGEAGGRVLRTFDASARVAGEPRLGSALRMAW